HLAIILAINRYSIYCSLCCEASRRSLSCFLPRRPRHKEEEPPVLLLRDMGLCYRLLERLVPALVPGIAASRLEILQHVIDYILELQTELDASCPAGDKFSYLRSRDIKYLLENHSGI
uniref:BHLH domain-containing protein n=1 Tax=Amphiprion percula TaxID=161767 RepID=A0A3P8TL46_AMPPE